MRRFLRILGRILSVLYPYNLHHSIMSALEVVYTGWRISGFRESHLSDKFGLRMHISGKQYISMGKNIYIGGYGFNGF